jgi:Putative methyltransferase
MNSRKFTVEFGDFQTPPDLTRQVCECLLRTGISPRFIIEPTCGRGEFLMAASHAFPNCNIAGYEINLEYCSEVQTRIELSAHNNRTIEIHQADFLKTEWKHFLPPADQELLVLGNPPWVTNSVLSSIDSDNAPIKTNFQARTGLEAMTGSANFDISEWMLLEMLGWFQKRNGVIAMLVKSAVARKVLMHAHDRKVPVSEAWLAKIDAKQHFDVSVDSCLLFIRFDSDAIQSTHGYQVYPSLELKNGQEVGLFDGIWVSDLQCLLSSEHLLRKGKSNNDSKWRSGIKHDAAAVCELTQRDGVLYNGLNEPVAIEESYLYPLMKGSEVAKGAVWTGKKIILTQQSVGQNTDLISMLAPKTWSYLIEHADVFDRRASSVYKNNPRFSIFGVGDYSFKPWRIAICSLYKKLNFVLVAPIEGKPVMFDDTVYYLSFSSKEDAQLALEKLLTIDVQELLNAMIFWDDKRPIKTSILNRIQLNSDESTPETAQSPLEFA